MSNKSNRSNRQPSPAPQPQGETGVTGDELPVEAASNISDHPTRVAAGKNAFALFATSVSSTAVAKMTVVGDVRDALKEAKELYAKGDAEADKALEIVEDAALRLYKARSEHLLSADDVTGLLGDIFGYKAKKDGSPSKTPEAKGEAIRKRVQRAVKAREYVEGTDEPDRFFADLPTEGVGTILNRMEKGELSIWSAYDYLAEFRRDNATRVPPEFNVKNIAGLAAAILKDGVPANIASNGALRAAYSTLYKALEVVGEEIANIDATKKEAKAA